MDANGLESFAQIPIASASLQFMGSGWSEDEAVALAMDRLAVNLGREIVKLVDGYVSTEVHFATDSLF
eukprot:6193389-Pleurochrysis_carterae.AAC.1